MSTEKEKKATDYVIFVSGKTYDVTAASKKLGWIQFTDERNVVHTVSSYIIKKNKNYAYIGDLIK